MNHSSRKNDTDMQELVDSLPIPSNAPPFLHGLISSLQCYQASNRQTASYDISQMLTAFRQITAIPPDRELLRDGSGVNDHRDENSESVNTETEVNAKLDGSSLTLSRIEALIDQKMEKLERRMQGYIDAKFAEIMNHIEKIEKRNITKRNSVTTNGEGTSGINFEEHLD